jgi:glutathione S-transferase
MRAFEGDRNMLTVHHLGKSQSERIVWLCEELELPYELVLYEREPIGAAPPAYKALHPYGTAPVITDGDFVLGESGAIIEYLCHMRAEGRLTRGPGDPDYADYLYWFHFSNASMVAGVMMDFVARRLGAEPVGDRSDRAYKLADQRLASVPYFAGEELTAADIMMGYPIINVTSSMGRDLTPYPHVAAYIARIGERPAYRRARAKAEPDAAA